MGKRPKGRNIQIIIKQTKDKNEKTKDLENYQEWIEVWKGNLKTSLSSKQKESGLWKVIRTHKIW